MPASDPVAHALVAIIGRANVGKSTLFNTLTRSTQALVGGIPGVTRDRHFGRVVLGGRAFLLVDTGGLVGAEDELGLLVRRQAEAAVAEADAILLVMDGKEGPQAGDAEVVDYLRTTGKPLFLVVNKIDHPGREEELPDFYRFGLSPLYPVSAVHKLGLSPLLEDLLEALPEHREIPAETPGIRVAVVGRPNVGKSSFINRVVGEERLIVSDRPGTTRDVIDTPVTFQGTDYVLIDTAGLRRPSHVAPGLEKYTVLKALKALERCDVALLLLDPQEGVTSQDMRIANLIAEEGKGCVVGLNKWDLVPREVRAAALEKVKEVLNFLPYAPKVSLSVLTGHNLKRIFPLIDEVYQQLGRRVGTGELNQLFALITQRVRPPLFRYRPIKFYYLTQPETHPPTFIAFVNHPEGVPDSYRRYLVKELRQGLNLNLAPIRLFLKKRSRRGSG
ncbi:MAG: ribosome biogenesis GTPase Der [Syntrophobacterales bacterium]|jgi:GTP-binding protein